MIIYFSGTGNSKYAAEQLAEKLYDRAVTIEGLSSEIHLSKGENLGIVTPTYWGGLSVMMRDFIRSMKLTADGDNYIWLAATYGLLSGFSGKDCKDELKNKGIKLDASYVIRMPEIWTPIFSAKNEKKNDKLNAAAEDLIANVAAKVAARTTGDFPASPLPYFAHPVTQALVESERKTSHFHVTDACIGCTLCAKKCPAQAIEMKNGRPEWVKDKCAVCLRCLHHCPKFAIQYGMNTKRHGQYVNPNTKV